MSRVQVLESLQQITNDLTINFSNFDVKHSDFPNLDVPAATLELLKETPQDVQINLFTLKLMELIYEVYYLGTKVKDIPEESETNENLLKKIASQEVDWEFYEQLENNNYSRGWFHPDFQVLTRSSDGYLAVNYDSVTIYVHMLYSCMFTLEYSNIYMLYLCFTPASPLLICVTAVILLYLHI